MNQNTRKNIVVALSKEGEMKNQRNKIQFGMKGNVYRNRNTAMFLSKRMRYYERAI